MQNSVISKVNISTRILILLLFIISIFITKSIYLLILLSILCLILLVLTNKSVKFYIETLKNVKWWLLFIFIAYIIIFRNVLVSIMFLYKTVLVILIIKQFSMTVNFNELANGINVFIKPLEKVLNLYKTSYNLVLFMYFIKIYIETKKEILSNYSDDKKLKYSFSLKYNILPRIFLTMSKTNELESSLKLKFYRTRVEEKNLISNVVLYVCIAFFIVIIFKEVIV